MRRSALVPHTMTPSKVANSNLKPNSCEPTGPWNKILASGTKVVPAGTNLVPERASGTTHICIRTLSGTNLVPEALSGTNFVPGNPPDLDPF